MAIPHVSSASNSIILYPHKDSQTKPVEKPLVSSCEEPPERISSFVETLLKLIAKTQKSNF